MSQQVINVGAQADDGTGDPLRTAGQKINDNFTEVYAALVPVGAIVMWSGSLAAAADLEPTWAICDGTANAPGPDLRDKFIIGASQDEGGVAKTNIEGSLKVTGGATGHSHSGHANLTHAGGGVADHTGLTHGVTIADHPDLTHAALSHAAMTFSHADHAIPSGTHSHAAVTLTHGDHAVASFSGSHAAANNLSVPSGSVTIASGTHSHGATTLTPTLASLNTGVLTTPTAATRGTLSATTLTAAIASFTGTHASQTGSIASLANASAPSGSHTHAAQTLTHGDHSVASFSGTHAGQTVTHADHSFPSLSHQEIGTHANLSHAITAPAAHGTAGTLTHSYTEPNVHAISSHDTVMNVPNYYAMAFIQRMQ